MKSCMNIEDYTIDASAFEGLSNAETIESVNFSNFADKISYIDRELIGSGVNIFRSDGSLMLYDENSRSFWIIPDVEKPIKIVFDNNGIRIMDESEVDLCKDIEVASEEELNLFIKGAS